MAKLLKRCIRNHRFLPMESWDICSICEEETKQNLEEALTAQEMIFAPTTSERAIRSNVAQFPLLFYQEGIKTRPETPKITPKRRPNRKKKADKG